MKRHWYPPLYLPLTDDQFQRLKKGLLTDFRFQLRLEIDTVLYDKECGELTVIVPDDSMSSSNLENIGYYINGFLKAIAIA